jgi:hypothetical protein
MEKGNIMQSWPQSLRDEVTGNLREVDALAKRIGHWHLMHIASALWRKSLKDDGCPEDEAHIPTAICFIKKSGRDMTQSAKSYYDKLAKDITL